MIRREKSTFRTLGLDRHWSEIPGAICIQESGQFLSFVSTHTPRAAETNRDASAIFAQEIRTTN
jgi:hypothetical protein